MRVEVKFIDLLKGFIYKYTVVTVIIVLGIVIGLYGFLHFGVSLSMMEEIEDEVVENIREVIHHEVKQLDFQLDVVEKHTLLLKETYEDIFENYEQYDLEATDAEFSIHENGVYYKIHDNGGSSLYYSAITPLTDYTIEKAIKTEWADPIMKHIVNHDDMVSQVYFNSFDNMSRLYPFIPDIPNVLGPTQEVRSYNFYYLADKKHNPMGYTVWTLPYLDPAGQGWMISCLAPVYRDGFLEGVVGLDVTLKHLIHHSLDMNRIDETIAMLISDSGIIIAMNHEAEIFLGMDELTDKEHGMENVNVVKPYDNNIYEIKNMEQQDVLRYAYDHNEGEVRYKDDVYILNTGDVKETGWKLIGLTRSSYVNKNIDTINQRININLMIILLIVLILIFVILIVYRKRIDIMSRKISEPLAEMAGHAKQFGVDGEFTKIKTSGIKEIDDLNRELFVMSKEIKNRTLKLLQAQIENQKAEKTIEAYYKDAITDDLTQLYNRRKIDDVIDSEVKRSQRHQQIFSIILLDIDYFKEINDQYGHQTGDEVIKGVAKILLATVRKTDVVARWGGDEFLIVIYQSQNDIARKLAEKIRLAIKDAVIYANISVTTSIGVADFDYENDDARDILKKADLALYEAKNRGKNNVVQYVKDGVDNEYI